MAELEVPQADGLSQLPASTIAGVYFLWHGDLIVYVGQSHHITKRIFEHIKDRTKRFDGMSYIEIRKGRLRLERYFIEKLLPKYNRCGIASSMRKLRQHGYDAPAKVPYQPKMMSGPEAAELLGIPLDKLCDLPTLRKIERWIRVPRANIMRRQRRYAREVLLQWVKDNPDLVRSLQSP